MPPTAVLGLSRPEGRAVAQFSVAATPESKPVPLPGTGAGAGRAFDTVRAASSRKFTTAAGVVTLRPGWASVAEKTIFDGAKELSDLLASEEPCCPLDWRIEHNPLSLTGDLFTYERMESGEMACGPPQSSGHVRAVDLRTLAPANLKDFVTERSLLAALRRDSWIRRRGDSEAGAAFAKYVEELGRAQTSEEMIAVLSQRLGFDASVLWKQFCVLGYDARAGTVTIRLVTTRDAGFDHSTYLQLGLVVEPLPDFKAALEKVSASTGFFAGAFPNGVVKTPKSIRPR